MANVLSLSLLFAPFFYFFPSLRNRNDSGLTVDKRRRRKTGVRRDLATEKFQYRSTAREESPAAPESTKRGFNSPIGEDDDVAVPEKQEILTWQRYRAPHLFVSVVVYGGSSLKPGGDGVNLEALFVGRLKHLEIAMLIMRRFNDLWSVNVLYVCDA